MAGVGDVLRLGGATADERLEAGAEGGYGGGRPGVQLQVDPVVQADQTARQQLNFARGKQHQVQGGHLHYTDRGEEN